ncbi:DMT family transporter [Ralstonia mannitolilytica]|uniref:Threonine/homoserine exporter RhtA n=2 Tax=Ralstonia mannitolilytica TaxID=105219 RepID=A0AAD2APR3_9RALS|nr:DMT family transporter [Ralstonia mannitolilytica]CAJ0685810.1 Threonine/homoserine exporter RhtA [Ralstonia mannitolilytica]CAJ0702883.1 Threonine/homoserine exporter RhtA [Ralstonia mannitolilytica]CAJ0848588.1 Threonine/homoserine exporter RhtA [Ralstonia mannitolilytica]
MPILALMGSMASVCLGNSFAKTLFPVLGAAGTVTYRVSIGAAILLAFWRPWRLHLGRADAGRIALYGVTLASMNLLFYLSLQRLPIGIAIAIEFTGPLVLAVLLSRRALDFVWIGLAVAGLLMLTVADKAVGHVDHLGAAYALAAGVCWALYILTGKNLGGLDAGQATSLGMTVGALFALPFGVAQAGSSLLSPSLMLAGLGIGVLSSAIPYSLEMVALKHLPGKTFSVLLSLEPAIGALAGAIVLHEQLTGRQWVAILAIIAASAGCALTVRAPKPPVEPGAAA